MPSNNRVYTCPVCNGSTTVSRPPSVPGDQTMWTSTTTNPQYPCRACKATGIVFAPVDHVDHIEILSDISWEDDTCEEAFSLKSLRLLEDQVRVVHGDYIDEVEVRGLEFSTLRAIVEDLDAGRERNQKNGSEIMALRMELQDGHDVLDKSGTLQGELLIGTRIDLLAHQLDKAKRRAAELEGIIRVLVLGLEMSEKAISLLPTWVEQDSYAAQVDMRARAVEAVRTRLDIMKEVLERNGLGELTQNT